MAGHVMVEGDTVIDRALRAGLALESVLVDAQRTAAMPWDALVYRAGPDVLRAVCGRPRLRDPIARFVRPPALDLDEAVDGARTVLMLEGVVNPTNVGVLMRNAAALGVDAALVDSSSCDPLYRRAIRVSMGEVFAIRHARCGSAADTLGRLRALGLESLALTPAPDAVDIGAIERRPEDRIVIVLGAEGAGLTDATQAAADRRVRIPMAAGVDSINVGAAGAVAFHALRAD